MDAGLEFEYSQQKLELLAEKIINNEENCIIKINNMKNF